MTDDARRSIDDAIDETTWTPLAAHAKRGALFLVDPSIGLATAGNAVALDRKAVVAHWIAAALLRLPTDEERARWDAASESFAFRFVIVQPYVLAERTPAADAN